jgi:hypothetical protein
MPGILDSLKRLFGGGSSESAADAPTSHDHEPGDEHTHEPGDEHTHEPGEEHTH